MSSRGSSPSKSRDRSRSGSSRSHSRDRSRSESRSRSRSRSRSSTLSRANSEKNQKENKTKKHVKDIKPKRGKDGGGKAAMVKSSGGPNSRNSRVSPRGNSVRSGRPYNAATGQILSMGRIKLNELRNRVVELTAQVAALEQENKDVRRMHRTQDRKIAQYEAYDNDIPSLLQRQSEESNMLREQLRQTKERCTTKEKKLRDTEDELDRTKRLLKKMKGLVDDKKLAEREDLTTKLEKITADIDEKDKIIKNLERHIENLTNNHKHEFGIEHARHRNAVKRVDELKAEAERLHMILKEKEKELDMKNIYNIRHRPPHRMSDSLRSTPAPGDSDSINGGKGVGGMRAGLGGQHRGMKSNGTDINGRFPHPQIEKKGGSMKGGSVNGGGSANWDGSLYGDGSVYGGGSVNGGGSMNGAGDRSRRSSSPGADPQTHSTIHSKDSQELSSTAVSHPSEGKRISVSKTTNVLLVDKDRSEEGSMYQKYYKSEVANTTVKHSESRVQDKREQMAEHKSRVKDVSVGACEVETDEQRRQKELLLARMKAIDNGDSIPSAQTTQTVNGNNDEPSFGGYKPSFLTSTVKPSTNRRAEQSDDLFGDPILSGGGGKGRNTIVEEKRSSSPALANFTFDSNVGNKTMANNRNGRVLPRRTQQPVSNFNYSGFGVIGDD